MVDLEAMTRAGLRIVHESMHGSGAGYIRELIGQGTSTVTELHAATEPAPPPWADPQNQWDLEKMVVVRIDQVAVAPLQDELVLGSQDTIILRAPPSFGVGFAGYFLVSQALPLVMLAWASALPFLQTPSARAFASLSLGNFRSIPSELLMRIIGNTAILMVAVPTLTMIASFAMSWVVLRAKTRGAALVDFLAFLPVTVPPIVFSVAALLLALFVLRAVVPLYGTIWLLVIVYAVARLSYGTRMTNTALIQIHRELEEAAQMSGAGTAGVLRAVLLPLLAPTILYAWIWIALLSYRELTLPVVLATGANLPFSMLVWSYVQSSSYGRASAAALIMLTLMVPVLLLYWLAARRAGLIAPR